MGRREDGSMYLIHEATDYLNNEMIDICDVELSHYRDLIGEEYYYGIR